MKTLTRSKPRQGFAGIPAQSLTPRDHRRFLVELANLPEIQSGNDAVVSAWGRFTMKFLPWMEFLHLVGGGFSAEDGTSDSPFGIGATVRTAWMRTLRGRLYLGGAAELSATLRRAWSKPTCQERETGILAALVDLSQYYSAKSGRRFALVQEPLAPAFLQAIHAADLMRVCQNPDCPARYFIADRRTQKFCSEKCAGPAQREAKRRWWNENRAGMKPSKRKAVKRGLKSGNKRRAKAKK